MNQPDNSTRRVQLRDVVDTDLPIFFEQQLDPEANWMAAFTSEDPTDEAAFQAHWKKIRGDEAVLIQTILADDQVAGYLAHFIQFGDPSLSYWLGKEYWGQGLATQALAAFLKQVPTRPLYARAAKDNVASIRVLEKCGFVVSGDDKGYAHARGEEIDEVILRLDA